MKHDLRSTFAVLKPDQSADLVTVMPSVFQELDRRYAGFRGHVLVSLFSFEADWPSWERHPAGDELVCLISGEVTMVLERDGVEDKAELRNPGEFVLIPKGTWHTARTRVPTTMLFVTPGEGTQNKPA